MSNAVRSRTSSPKRLEAVSCRVSLEETLKSLLPDSAFDTLKEDLPLVPESYGGHPDVTCDAALRLWQQRLTIEEEKLQKQDARGHEK